MVFIANLYAGDQFLFPDVKRGRELKKWYAVLRLARI